jgi:NAD-dependent deacetylase
VRVPATLIAELRKALRVAVLTGAGISAESGLATFRDKLSGLWEKYSPMQFATPAAFAADPELVWGWYEWRRMRASAAEPNAGHQALAKLQQRLAVSVVTQNVDDLHERAGATQVIHLHGSIHAPRCEDCSRPHAATAPPLEPEAGRRVAPPRCASCGGRVRPGVVWFGEALPAEQWQQAEDAVRQCQVFLSIGTSGVVEPAASLARYARRRARSPPRSTLKIPALAPRSTTTCAVRRASCCRPSSQRCSPPCATEFASS